MLRHASRHIPRCRRAPGKSKKRRVSTRPGKRLKTAQNLREVMLFEKHSNIQSFRRAKNTLCSSRNFS